MKITDPSEIAAVESQLIQEGFMAKVNYRRVFLLLWKLDIKGGDNDDGTMTPDFGVKLFGNWMLQVRPIPKSRGHYVEYFKEE